MKRMLILVSVLSLLTAVTGCSNPYQETAEQEVIAEKYNSHSANVIYLSAAAETSESAYTIQDICNLYDKGHHSRRADECLSCT